MFEGGSLRAQPAQIEAGIGQGSGDLARTVGLDLDNHLVCRRSGAGGDTGGAEYGQGGVALGDGGDHVVGAGKAADVVEGTRLHQAPATDDGHVIADLLHLGQLMAGNQYGLARGRNAPDQYPHLGDAGRVEPVGRFVEDQQIGVLQQRSGDGESLTHAQRVGAERVLVAVLEVDDLEDPIDLGPRDPSHRGEQLQVLAPGEVREHLRTLDDGADSWRNSIELRRCIDAEDTTAARGGPDESQEATNGRCLARPIRPQEPVNVASVPEFEIKPFDGDDVVRLPIRVDLAEMLDLDDGGHCGGPNGSLVGALGSPRVRCAFAPGQVTQGSPDPGASSD